jgi:hypothetical protein
MSDIYYDFTHQYSVLHTHQLADPEDLKKDEIIH